MWAWLSKFFPRTNAVDRLGDRGECATAKFLKSQGFRILERQYRGHFGELDIIAIDGDTVVFVEVKTRSTTTAGDPTEAVDLSKQRKITKSALAYLKQKAWLDRRCRFDVVAILWDDGGEKNVIKHYRSAFEATGFGQLY